ncbi:MAG: hypothetical protein IIV93_00360, partial [Clostridia bacterium]|nr:hypothetical protein [Clostridia bacterium]
DGVMDCTTSFQLSNGMLFRDVRALAALLKFAKRFAADYTAIRFSVPQGVRIHSLIGEGNAVKCSAEYNGMTRLVNVKRALELCACRGTGSVNIAVTDGIIEQMLSDNPEDWICLFEAAQYYAKKCNYARAIELYEQSFEKTTRRPRFTDELMGIRDIYVILGEYGKAADTCGRIIDLLENEWGIKESDELKALKEKKAELLKKA